MLRQCDGGGMSSRSAPDALTSRDDAEVAAALERDPEGFAARPSLPGRRPETGAYARLWRERAVGLRRARRPADRAPRRYPPNAGRYRGVDIAQGHRERTGDCRRTDIVRRRLRRVGVRARAALSFGASGRGRADRRLWHSGADGLEFSPGRPLVAELLGARIGRGEAARSAAKKMAALIDPCIAFEVEVREFADA